MTPEQAIPGTPVWYQPVALYGVAYAGIIDSLPWELGGHTWVAHLRNMHESYRKGSMFRDNRVVAAALAHLSVRSVV